MTTGHGRGDEGWRARKDGTHFWATAEPTPIGRPGVAVTRV